MIRRRPIQQYHYSLCAGHSVCGFNLLCGARHDAARLHRARYTGCRGSSCHPSNPISGRKPCAYTNRFVESWHRLHRLMNEPIPEFVDIAAMLPDLVTDLCGRDDAALSECDDAT